VIGARVLGATGALALGGLCALLTTVVALSAAAPAQSAPPTRQRVADRARPATGGPGADPAFLTRYCVTCHNERTKTGGLALDVSGLDRVGEDVDTWERVVRKLRTGMMPPAGMPRPDRATIDGFAAALEHAIDRANPAGRHLDTPAFQRLNRTEYANAIRDLLALDVDVRSLLPADDSSQGFDNIAEALTVSPALVQSYVAAALRVSRQAIGNRAAAPSQTTYSAPPQWVHERHVDGLPLGTRGGFLATHTFPLDAEYEFSVAGGPGGGATIDITLDGAPVKPSSPRSFRQRVAAGPHTIGLALVDRQRAAGVDDLFSDHRVDAAFSAGGSVQGLTIVGPFQATGPGDTPSRRAVFACRPVRATEEPACARRILTRLARRAYRRPPTTPELDTLMAFYAEGRGEADFEAGVERALARILVAPGFLFRTETPPAGLAPGRRYRLTDLELATRLSFFLWSSIPDDELLTLAETARLSRPAVLAAQVRRMLASPKSHALVENFAGQWLYLRDLETLQTEATAFDDNLRASLRKETELLVDSILREDAALTTLLDADYTFVDERLAKHYGLPGVYGSAFRRVALPSDSPRRGILGHGSMQSVTSVATRTSPVARGKWVLENLLGAPPPQPPPGVEVNLDAKPGAAPTTLRQRLELHRANPVCASCHKVMDPIGFALENFDLVGAWRTTDGPGPIDATGQLADGTPLGGPVDLRRAILDRKDSFMMVAAEKLMTYAIGRPMLEIDRSAVRAVARRAARDDNRLSALVLGVVESPAFQSRVKKL
jgi:hypothetical protein